jgi:hypothetical protein
MDDLREKIRGVLDMATDSILEIAGTHAQQVTVARLRDARLRARADYRKQKGYGEHPRFPAEKEGLAFMIKLHADGHPYRKIVEEMERRGYDLRSGGGWNPGTVKRILDREKAKGNVKEEI